MQEKYAARKVAEPHDGRRLRKLKLAQDFWALSREDKRQYEQSVLANVGAIQSILEEINKDIDPTDDLVSPGLGLVVRTDFTDDESWNTFCTALKEAEDAFLSDMADMAGERDEDIAEDSAAANDEEMEEDSSSEDEPDDEGTQGATTSSSPRPTSPSIFTTISPQSADDALRAVLINSSNLTVLSLFTDVDIVKAPSPPEGTLRMKPGNRLMDLDGFVEAYNGDVVWIYDAQSNRDRSVRSVCAKSESYGTATYVF